MDDTDPLISKSETKRQFQRLAATVDELLKLPPADRHSLALPEAIEAAIELARSIRTHGGAKRQRGYIAKLLRTLDNDALQAGLERLRHRHDTNTAQFKRTERWRDRLIEADKEAINEVIARHPDVDRQHLNQLIRTAQRERQQAKPPAAARKLFRYLRELEQSVDAATDREPRPAPPR